MKLINKLYMANKGEYTSAIELKGMVDGYKKVAWDLQKVLNLR